MKFTLERVTQPDIEPVTLAEMKRHLRVTADAEDADITGLIAGAREWVEDYTGRALIDQTWRLTLGDNVDLTSLLPNDTVAGPPLATGRYYGTCCPTSSGIQLRKAPVIELLSVASVDSAGAETQIDVAGYQVLEPQSKWPRIAALTGATWTGGTLRIEFRAGFADRLGSPKDDATKVPVRFKQAMKLWAEAMYDRDPVLMPLLLDAAAQIVKPERSELQIA